MEAEWRGGEGGAVGWPWSARRGREKGRATRPSLRQQNPDPPQTEGGGSGFAQKKTSARWLAGTRAPTSPNNRLRGHSSRLIPTGRPPPSAPRELGRCRGSPHRDLQVTSAGNPSRPLSPHSLWLLTDGWGRGQAAQSQWPGNPRSGSTEDGNKIAISALGAAGRGCHSPACTEGLGEGCA